MVTPVLQWLQLVSWTGFALTAGINMREQQRTAGCSVCASYPNFYWICQVFLIAQAVLFCSHWFTYISRINTRPLMKATQSGCWRSFRNISEPFRVFLYQAASSTCKEWVVSNWKAVTEFNLKLSNCLSWAVCTLWQEYKVFQMLFVENAATECIWLFLTFLQATQNRSWSRQV